jgi:phospholipid transport system substrate-binding protein
MKSILVALAAILLGMPSAFAEDQSPNEVIESAVSILTERMDGQKEALSADREAMYALIDEVLLPRFDRKFAAKYADGLLEFDQDKVSVLPFRGDATSKRAKVRTTIKLDDGSSASVDYELVKRESGWLLFNVIIEGISYVRNFRAELDSEIRSSSLDAVIERLEGEAGISSDG